MTDTSRATDIAAASESRPRRVRIGIQLWPGGTPDYATWRRAVRHAEELGADVVFGYDHLHKPGSKGVSR